MKKILTITAAALMIAGSASVATAGKPATPGGGGQFKSKLAKEGATGVVRSAMGVVRSTLKGANPALNETLKTEHGGDPQ